jgi:hypothetical protein
MAQKFLGMDVTKNLTVGTVLPESGGVKAARGSGCPPFGLTKLEGNQSERLKPVFQYTFDTMTRHPLLLVFMVTSVPAILMVGCRPSAPSEFKAAQEAFLNVTHVTVEWTAQTDKGSFQQTAEMDCRAPYYHRHLVKDLTPRGVEAGTREALGQPRSHQDTEYLFVGGRSFTRTSGEWGFAAKPDWAPSPGSYNPKSECQDLQEGKDPEGGEYVPDVQFIPVVDFARILSENKMEYIAERALENGPCREYRVVYPSSVETNQTSTSNGTYTSYDLKTVTATMCMGTKDHLPKQVVQGDWTVKYSYGEIEKLPAPSVPLS